MALGRQVYNLLFRRTSTFALTVVVGVLFFERVFDQGADALYEHLNKGDEFSPSGCQFQACYLKIRQRQESGFFVFCDLCNFCKMWKHIKHKYETDE